MLTQHNFIDLDALRSYNGPTALLNGQRHEVNPEAVAIEREAIACLLGRVTTMSQNQLTNSRLGQQSQEKLQQAAHAVLPGVEVEIINELSVKQLVGLLRFAVSHTRDTGSNDTVRERRRGVIC